MELFVELYLFNYMLCELFQFMLILSWCWHRCGRGFLDSYMPKTTEVRIYYMQPGSGQRVSLRKKPGGYTNIAWGYPSHVVLPNNSLYLHFVGDIAQTLHTFIHIHSIRQPAAPHTCFTRRFLAPCLCSMNCGLKKKIRTNIFGLNLYHSQVSGHGGKQVSSSFRQAARSTYIF